MTLEDFVYDDIQLSDMGGIIGYVVTSPSQSVDMGSVITINPIKNNTSFKNRIANIDYETPLEVTFDIVKDTCTSGEYRFTDDEVSEYMTWLNSKEYKKFVPLYDDDSFPSVYFYGTFTTVQAITLGKNTVGFTVTFTTNSPFAYSDIGNGNVHNFTLDSTNNYTYTIYSDDQEITGGEAGAICPDLVVTINDVTNGTTLKLYNDRMDSYVSIDNVQAGEVITIDGENKVITSSMTHTKLYNDFNYEYLKLVTTYSNNKNIISSNLNVTIKLTYEPRRKVGIFV